MEKESFDINELKLHDWQYSIRHTDVNNFVCGEKVFLKSNPECPMMVKTIGENTITTVWFDLDCQMQFNSFSPECLLQYKYKPLVNYRKQVDVCSN